MASMSTYLRQRLLDHALGTRQYTMPSQVYVALLDARGDELSGNSYARVSVDFTATTTGGQASPTSTVRFPQASGDWGTVRSVALYDASTSGNVLFQEDLTVERTVLNGDTFQFATDRLIVSLT